MRVRCAIRKGEYLDSIFLMRVADRISRQPGIGQVAAVMATPANKDLLAEAAFDAPEIAGAGPNDLVVCVRGDDTAALDAVLAGIDAWLAPEPSAPGAKRVRTLDEAIATLPGANLAVISVPGEHAAREARRALERGLHVFLFSDNVALQDEIALKALARERGLMVMGPDCGTAIVGGRGIGFANVVRRGPIGVVGASGTGIQEVTTLVDRAGYGISHAIGTGSHDPSDEVGAVSTLAAIDALDADPSTRVIVVVSKPPGPRTLRALEERIGAATKPVVACFLGVDVEAPGERWRSARTLDEAAAAAVALASGAPAPTVIDGPRLRDRGAELRAGMAPRQRWVRGLFAGGSLCYQAQHVFRHAGVRVRSNVPLEGGLRLDDPRRSVEHTFVDLGADEFTRGRPHPMIDARLRRERILAESADASVAVLLLDVLLGHGAAADPGGDLAGAIRDARDAAAGRAGRLTVIASVIGTEADPQGLRRQTAVLEDAGAVTCASSAEAARLALAVSAWD